MKTNLLPPLVAEFFGSMLLVMSAIGSMIMFTVVLDSPKSIALIGNAIAVGFVLSALIEMFAPISGSHFNPVVTMIMWLDKKVDSLQAILFGLVQILGGVIGTLVTHLMFFDEKGGILFISENIRNGSRYFSEFLATFILLLVILMLAKTKSNKISLFIGLFVGGQIMITSSTMFANPQVTIARIFTSSVSGIRPVDGLVFVFMQIIGALVAYGVYKLIFEQKIKLRK